MNRSRYLIPRDARHLADEVTGFAERVYETVQIELIETVISELRTHVKSLDCEKVPGWLTDVESCDKRP